MSSCGPGRQEGSRPSRARSFACTSLFLGTATGAGLRLLQDLRRSLHDPPTTLLQRNSTKRVETGVAPTDSAAIAENYDA
jgi:hypothetical protein